jgi:NhaP-type Na+/H+ or K+/H+ antiporter
VNPWIDRAVNLAMLWTGSLLAGSGLLMEFRFQDTPRPASVWGLDWTAWATLHYLLGYVMICLIGLHLYRHRKWWWGALCRQRSLAVWLVFLIALALLILPIVGPEP